MKNNTAESVGDMLLKLVKRIVREEIEKNNAKQELHYDGIVRYVSDDNKTATVELSFTSLTIPNRSGDILEVDSTVRVYATMNGLGDAYVGVKLA